MLRHRTVPSSRSKAIALIAAGAFSIAGAASAAAATWTREFSAAPAGAAHAAVASADQLTRPAAAPQAGVSLAVRVFQIRAEQAGHAAAQAQATRRADAAQAAALAAQAQSAPQPQQVSTVAAYAATSGSPEQIAEAMLRSFGWSLSQFACLDPLWAHESGWAVTADNPDTGAYGIPQALPGDKMASAGPDWQTDAVTQIRWGLTYIKDLYGSPCAAYAHEQETGWY